MALSHSSIISPWMQSPQAVACLPGPYLSNYTEFSTFAEFGIILVLVRNQALRQSSMAGGVSENQ